ncbi:MAG: DUF3352 domain-containing protein [Planctomycetota bacterium]
MRVRCTSCGAVGNVESGEPGKRYKCPKCGGAMKAMEPAGPQAAPRKKPAPVVRKKPKLPRRARRKKGRVVSIVVFLAFLAAAGAGGWWLYQWSRAPGAGATALGLLPESTVAAGAIERVDHLPRELARLEDADRTRLRAALNTYREHAETWLVQELKLSRSAAADAVKSVAAGGVGMVPVEDGGPAVVGLLALDSKSAVSAFLAHDGPAPCRLGRKGNRFTAAFDRVVGICSRKEPLEQMVDSFGNEGAGSLGRDEAFCAARAAGAEQGRAWLYATGEAKSGLARAGPAGPKGEALAPAFDRLTGVVQFDGSRLVLRVRVAVKQGEEYYGQIRLAPGELRMPEYIPRDPGLAVAVSLGDPTETYEQILESLGERADQTGLNPKVAIRKFEHDHEGFYLQRDVLSVLSGEAGLFVPSWEEGFFKSTVLLAVKDPDEAEAGLRRLSETVLGSEPAMALRAGRPVLQLPSTPRIYCAFVDQMLVVTLDAEGVAAVRRAKDSADNLTANERFQQARGRLPERLSGLVYVRESDAKRGARSGGEPWAAGLGVAMGESELTLAAALPNLGQALLAHATNLRKRRPGRAEPEPATPQPGPKKETTKKPDPLHDSQNLERLVRLSKAFLAEKGRYPKSFSELIAEGHLAKDQLGWLVQPGDFTPYGTVDGQPTSFRTAFKAALPDVLRADTPGDVPMIWQIVSDDQGRRLIARFDGKVVLRKTRPGELADRVREAIDEIKQRGIPREPEKEEGETRKDDAPDRSPRDDAITDAL